MLAVLLAAEVILNGFLSALEGISENDLERRSGEARAEKLLHILRKPELFRMAAQAAQLVCGLIAGAYLLRTAVSWGEGLFGAGRGLAFWEELVIVLLTGILLLMIFLIFGFFLPGRLARRYPEGWAFVLRRPARFLSGIFYPAAWAARLLGRLLLRLFRIDPDEETENVTEEEIMSMVNEGHEKGVLQASEAEMITNIFEFDDKEAADIMTHRTNIKALDGQMKLEDAVQEILSEDKSRFPVYEEDIDDILGMVHIKDAVIAMNQAENKDRTLKEVPGLIREVHFIPETRNINLLFQSMQSHKLQMVIVVDEYGQTSGLITMEDILEEIVGNLMDEYDSDETHIRPAGPDTWIADGSTELDEVEEVTGVRFEEEEIETLNGFLVSQLDRIPQAGEQPEISYGGCRFCVLKVENNMIQKIRILREKAQEEEQEEVS